MKLSDVEARLVPWYNSSVAPGGPSYLLRSGPGRGKTSVLMSIPEKLRAANPGKNYGIVVLNGACLTNTAVTGYLWPEERDGTRYSHFTRPNWWITSEGYPLEAYDGGVIFIDEEDKIALDEKKITGEAALSKVFGTHRLPPGWVVWFAGNRGKDRSGSTKELDHLILRRRTIEVQDDIKSLVDWMKRNNCLDETIAFAEDNSQIVFMDPPDVQGPYCTPRTLVQADIAIQSWMEYTDTDVIPTDALTQEELAGGIGIMAAAQYIATIKLGQELPPYEQIVAKPKATPMPRKPDALRLAAYKLASRVESKDLPAVLDYMDGRMPDEFQMVFGRAAIQRDLNLALHPVFAKWCGRHSALIALLNALK